MVTFFSTAVAFTSLLFFFRTRAIFNRNQWVVVFFASLWLAVLGGCLAFVVDVFNTPSPAPNSTHKFCIKENISPFVAAATIIPLINDTLTFLAVSWRLFRNSYVRHTLKNGIRLLVFGDYLPVFSKALLQNGQAYYLSALLIHVSCLKWLTGCFFPQDHYYHESRRSDHFVQSFDPQHPNSSNNVHSSECRIDEYHGLPSTQEFSTLWR